MMVLAELLKSKLKNMRPIYVTIILLVIAIISSVDVNGQNVLCPEVLKNIVSNSDCTIVKCVTTLSVNGCPVGTEYKEKLTLCGCCPGCAAYIPIAREILADLTCPLDPEHPPVVPCKRNESPPHFDGTCKNVICPVETNQCEPGLQCMFENSGSQEGHCCHPYVKENSTTVNPCTEECIYRKTLFRKTLFHWDPVCEEDGSYAPKQCKGVPNTYGGQCFCVDRCGKRISGRQWWAKAENQTCACSRMVSELRREDTGLHSGNKVATLHCDAEGNFEALQCDTDSGNCFCVDIKTGKTTGAMLPEAQWKYLPCFNNSFPNVTAWNRDGTYLRRCESQYAASKKLRIEGLRHGLSLTLPPFDCDYDGSFGPMQINGSQSLCTHKNGARIKDYFKAIDHSMDCNCARDEVYFTEENRPFSFSGACILQKGTYDIAYPFGNWSSCFDSDGFPFGSNDVPATHICCLLEQCKGEEIPKECHTEKYYPCWKWQYKMSTFWSLT